MANVRGRRLEIKEVVHRGGGGGGGGGEAKGQESDEGDDEDEDGGRGGDKPRDGETVLKAMDTTEMESSIVFCRY